MHDTLSRDPWSSANCRIMQLKKRGAPVCLGGVPEPMDLTTGRPARRNRPATRDIRTC